MSKEYWVRTNGKVTGPFSAEQVHQMLEAGMLGDDDKLAIETSEELAFRPLTHEAVDNATSSRPLDTPQGVGVIAQEHEDPSSPAPANSDFPETIEMEVEDVIDLSQAAPSQEANTSLRPETHTPPQSEDKQVSSQNGSARHQSSTPKPPTPEPKEQNHPEFRAPVVGQGQRNQIVILGRRGSGKTCFIVQLYAQLWNSLESVSASAISGLNHREIMFLYDGLRKGTWPAATLGTDQMLLELQYHGKKRLMTSMDYSGEVFRQAFVEDGRDESQEIKELLGHLDNAAGVMLLLDPLTVYENTGDMDAHVDLDFGMVQAVRRIRDWPGGEDIPVVIALTKSDECSKITAEAGGTVAFVKRHWPALARTLQKVMIYQVSAVQSTVDEDGRRIPRPDSKPINVVRPLKHLLRESESMERVQAQQRAAAMRAQAMEKQRQAMRREARKKTWIVSAVLIAVGLAILIPLVLKLIEKYRQRPWF